jgi:hypothetical protein
VHNGTGRTRPGVRGTLPLLAIGAASCLLAGNLILDRVFPTGRDQAVAEALGTAARLGRSSYLFASTYAATDLPSNTQVAGHLANQVGDRDVLSTSVRHDDPRGVGTLATVDVVLVGEGSRSWLSTSAERYPICVRFTVHRARTGPREIKLDEVTCPPGVTAERPAG